MKSIPRKPYRWFVVAICLLLPACLIQPLGQGSSKAAPAEQTQKDATKTLVDGDEKPDAEVIDRAFLVKWAQVAAEQDLDCPMSAELTEKMFATRTNGDALDDLRFRIGCSCAVMWNCKGAARPPAEQCFLIDSLKPLRARDGDTAAVLAWAERLFAKQNQPATALSRAEPIGPAPAPQENEEWLAGMADTVKKVKQSADERAYYFIPRYHESLDKQVKLYEKDLMCGQKSPRAREYLAQAKAELAAADKMIRAWKQVERALARDAKYQALRRKSERVSDQARQMAHDQHLRDGDYRGFCARNPGDKSRMCAADRDESDISYQMTQIEDRYKRKYGYPVVEGIQNPLLKLPGS